MKPRNIVKRMKAYSPAENKETIKLDANESSNSVELMMKNIAFNRYPDNDAKGLKRALSKYLSVDTEQLIVGNGSSEMIELILKTYINPGDKVMSFEPSFVMYKIFTELYNGQFVGVSSDDYVMDIDQMIKQAVIETPKIIFICNPNNPTGYLIQKTDIERLLKSVNSLVVVDEAYIEFVGSSMLNRLDQYDNLVILRTFSKAWGLAAARLGYMISNTQLIQQISKVKSPYNLNTLTQQLGCEVLKNPSLVSDNVQSVLAERNKVYKALINFGLKAYKSFANFIFFEAEMGLEKKLMDQNISIRSFGNGTYRVTVGTQSENTLFLEAMVEVLCIRDEVIYETRYTG